MQPAERKANGRSLRAGRRIMPHIAGILMIGTGFAIMAFGLFLFYAWLPLFYGLFGLEIGLLVGKSLTGTVGATAIILGIAVAIFFGAASYFLEPYRRILLGVSGAHAAGFVACSSDGAGRSAWWLLRHDTGADLRPDRRFHRAAIFRFIDHRGICLWRSGSGDGRRKSQDSAGHWICSIALPAAWFQRSSLWLWL